jgi:hypothetical protein
VVKDVDLARVLVGFHFRNSDLQGSNLGRKVGGYVAKHLFQPLGGRKVLHLGRYQRETGAAMSTVDERTDEFSATAGAAF